jgi:GNAT superfamily N-acetyltransferase
MEIEIRRIRPDEAETLKRTRLALLADSPAAFGSTIERELAFTDDIWAERAAGSSRGSTRSTFLALSGDDVVGIVGAGRAPGGTGATVELVSMWTAPATRRSGLGRGLVEAVVDWAASTGATAVELWVTRDNDPAQRLYESMGFVVTGDHQPLPSDPCKDELRMSRLLR